MLLSSWGLEFPIACTNGSIIENLAAKPDNFSLPHYGHRFEIFFVHFDTNWLDSVPQFICSLKCLSVAAVLQTYEIGGCNGGINNMVL
jgi:hypothetical protein